MLQNDAPLTEKIQRDLDVDREQMEASANGYSQPETVSFGSLEIVQNGYTGNNWDWSRWYYHSH